MPVHVARPEHEVAYQEVLNLVSKHAEKLSKKEILAVAANMLGKLIALQDQRELLPGQAMEIVAHNIEMGNKQAIEQLASTGGTVQ